MGNMRNKKRKLFIFCIFPACLIFIIYSGRTELLNYWYSFQLSRLSDLDQKALAIQLETQSEFTRAFIIDWYKKQLAHWEPNPTKLKNRTHEKIVAPDESLLDLDSKETQIIRFFYQDESRPVYFSSRLLELGIDVEPKTIANLLKLSKPNLLPKYSRRFKYKSNLHYLHYTSHYLYQLRKPAIPILIELLIHQDEFIRSQAFTALHQLNIEDERHKKSILNHLTNSKSDIRYHAFLIMIKNDPSGKIGIPILEKGLNEELEISQSCGLALLWFSWDSPKAIRIISEKLTSSNFPAKQGILNDLSASKRMFNSKQYQYLENALIKLLKDDPSSEVRKVVVNAIQTQLQFQSVSAHALANAIINDSDEDVRLNSVIALKKRAYHSKIGMAAIKKALEDPSEKVRKEAKIAFSIFKTQESSDL